MISFLESNGMESVVERGDRAFPASHLASDVVDTLVRAAEQAGAELCCNKEVSLCISESSGDTETLFRIMKEFRDNGGAIIYVSHKLEELFEL